MPDKVEHMAHAELAAWLETVLESLGVKRPNEDGQVIISKRLGKPKESNEK